MYSVIVRSTTTYSYTKAFKILQYIYSIRVCRDIIQLDFMQKSEKAVGLFGSSPLSKVFATFISFYSRFQVAEIVLEHCSIYAILQIYFLVEATIELF